MANTGAFLSGTERNFDADGLIVSKTDLQGKLVYGNRLFYELADLTEKDCLGTQHNIVRHPEMPRAVFDLLWKTIKNGKEIFSYVVNRASNGDHYWVFAHVTPSFDKAGEMNGYHSNRRVPDKFIVNRDIIPLYKKLCEIETRDPSPKSGLEKSSNFIKELLKKEQKEFNELMFSLGE
ncbi:MAG: PAS domain-containing protein [Sneathiella sp.]